MEGVQEKQEKPAASQNWADMEHEEDDDQEIGVQGATSSTTEETKKTEGESSAQEKTTEGGEEGKQYPRKRKDYGDAYNPNYKKGPWRKGQYPPGATEEQKKNFQAPVARQKTERGDYVVTSFQIPDRTTTKAEKKGDEEGAQKKKRRVGAFQIDDSDLEEEEVNAGAAVEESPVAQEEEQKVEAPVVVASKPAEVAKTLSKKEQKKRDLEELEALLGPTVAQPTASTTE